MEAMRELLRGSLGRSLSGMSDADRLAAAWTVACGRAMAEHGKVVGLEGGVVRIEVDDPVWLQQMISVRGGVAQEMARIAGVRVDRIHFELKRGDRGLTEELASYRQPSRPLRPKRHGGSQG